jgi:hypothetical protein
VAGGHQMTSHRPPHNAQSDETEIHEDALS